MNISSAAFKTASSSLPVGTRLAEFEITGVIGEGGFGIVYSANDSSLERMVAIKEYLPSAFAQRGPDGSVQVKSKEHLPTFQAGLSSFINEARMLAKFSHPGLVEVFRFWEANGTAYMAMRYYRGVTLRESLRSSRNLITEQWLCETLDPVLLALRELHKEKCYHRDIAPDNILVLPNGRSVLMDFGAARRIISGMTQALTTVLKPGYAPIEQYYDDGSMPQGAWTDIYAVGGLLYHVISGKVPVQAISRMMSDPLKPVSEIALGDFSQRLYAVVMQCMSVMPENRYQSVDELRAALGWVTTPVLAKAPQKPLPAPQAPEEYPTTVLMRPLPRVKAHPESSVPDSASSVHHSPNISSTQNAPLVVPVAPETELSIEYPATVLMRPSPRVKAQSQDSVPSSASENHHSPGSSSTQNASLVVRKAPKAASEPALSIDELASAPQAVQSPVSAKLKSIEHGVNQDLIAPKRKFSVWFWVLGAAVLIVAWAGLGYFVFGSKQTDVTETLIEVPPPAIVPTAAVSAASGSVPPSVPSSDVVVVPAVAPVTPISAPTVLASAPAVSAAATGNLRIELAGGWGLVFVDGEDKGTVPPVLSINLPAGQHDIEIRNPAMATEKRVITVNAGKTVVFRHSFVK